MPDPVNEFCIVTGNLSGISPVALPETDIYFYAKPGHVIGQSGDVVVSPTGAADDGVVRTDANGTFSISLRPGNYEGMVRAPNGPIRFLFPVYDEATRDLSTLIGAAAVDLPPQILVDSEAARDVAIAKAAQTEADADATAADRVQTGLDRVATGQDRVQTGLDRVASAADRVQTGLDRTQTGIDAAAAQTARIGAETAFASTLALNPFDQPVEAQHPLTLATIPTGWWDTGLRITIPATLPFTSTTSYLAIISNWGGQHLFNAGQGGANFDFANTARLFQADGVTVISLGQALALAVDDHRGLVLGAAIASDGVSLAGAVNNGNGTFTLPNGVSAAPRFTFPLASLANGKFYMVEVEVVSTTKASVSIDLADTPGVAFTGTGIKRFPASRSTYDATFRFVDVTAATSGDLVFKAPVLREVLLPVIYQPSTALRGLWGRAPAQARNLCVGSEDQATVWNNSISGTGVAPVKTPDYATLGGHPADRLQFSLGGGTTSADSSRLQANLSRVVQVGELMTVRFKAKLVTGTSAVMYYQAFWSGAGYFNITDVEQTFSVDLAAAGAASASINVGLRGGQTPVNPNTLDVLITDFEVIPTALKALPYQRVGTSSLDITETGVQSHGFIRLDLSDDTLPINCPAAITGYAVILGRNGSWIDAISVSAGGILTIGPTGTPATPGILRALGDIVDVLIYPTMPTAEEKARLMRKYRAKGALGFLNPAANGVTNGGYTSDLAGWNPGTGWAWNAGVAEKTAGSAAALAQAYAPAALSPYLVTLTLVRTAGTLLPRFTGGSTVSGLALSASGTYTQVLMAASGNNALEMFGDVAFAGSVDNVMSQPLTPEAAP